MPFRLVSLDGGKSRNAIPRDATAVVSVAGDREADFRAALEQANGTIRDAFAKTDAGVSVSVASADGGRDAVERRRRPPRCSTRWRSSRPGPLAMSPDFDDLVETSTSLGEAITEGDQLTLHSLSRSSNDSAMPDVIATLDAVARLARRRARGEAQLRRLAAEPRLADARGRARPCTSASSASRRS